MSSSHMIDSWCIACATIKVLEEEKIVENAAAMGLILSKLLYSMKEKHRSVGDVRSIGLFGALELVKSRETKEPFPGYAVAGSPMAQVMSYLKNHGIMTFSAGNLLMTNPPLIINEVCVHVCHFNELFFLFFLQRLSSEKPSR